jgi:hypothetical protein
MFLLDLLCATPPPTPPSPPRPLFFLKCCLGLLEAVLDWKCFLCLCACVYVCVLYDTFFLVY